MTTPHDPIAALVSMSPVSRLSEESARKRSRWGEGQSGASGSLQSGVVTTIPMTTLIKPSEVSQASTSRWGSEDQKPYLPPPFVDFPPGLTPAQLDQFLREQRYDELTQKLNKGELEYIDPDIRPPSPEPIYDKNGGRINTREARIKTSMMEEHSRLVEYFLKHLEGFVAPANYKPVKKIRKIEIPIDKYPEYNFMGLIIGPRGCNHKRLEAESGAQISIRGKGTQKEGKKTDHQTEEEANMPKHVHISADTEERVEKAVSLIIPLLDPNHPLHEEFKRKGLEQLAIVNGINLNQLDTQKCAFCGSPNHLTYECPDNTNLQNFKKPEVKCNLCGDRGHITLDCKLAKNNANFIELGGGKFNNSTFMSHGKHDGIPHGPPNNATDHVKMDLEYEKMISELSTDKDKKPKNEPPVITNYNNRTDMNPNYMPLGNSSAHSKHNYDYSNPNYIPLNRSSNTTNNNSNNNTATPPNNINSNNNQKNNSTPNIVNYNQPMNMTNIPIPPPPLPPMIPSFFNLPWMNNRMMPDNSMQFPNPQMPMDPLYMQNMQGWPQMPIGLPPDNPLLHAPAPDSVPPPLPSEDGVNLNEENQQNQQNQ